MRPLAGQRLLQPTRIFFAGGLSPNMASSSTGAMGGDALTVESVPYRRERMRRELQDARYDDTVEIIDASDDPVVLDACTGGTEDVPTLCETQAYENAWITFDLGETLPLYAVSIGLYPHPVSPPSPPLPQSPSPSAPPPAPPPAPPSFPPNLAPSPPYSPGCIADLTQSVCWDNLLSRTNNGLCEDGAEGSVSAVCAWGTDFPDCPARCPAPAPPPKPPPSEPLPPFIPPPPPTSPCPSPPPPPPGSPPSPPSPPPTPPPPDAPPPPSLPPWSPPPDPPPTPPPPSPPQPPAPPPPCVRQPWTMNRCYDMEGADPIFWDLDHCEDEEDPFFHSGFGFEDCCPHEMCRYDYTRDYGDDSPYTAREYSWKCVDDTVTELGYDAYRSTGACKLRSPQYTQPDSSTITVFEPAGTEEVCRNLCNLDANCRAYEYRAAIAQIPGARLGGTSTLLSGSPWFANSRCELHAADVVPEASGNGNLDASSNPFKFYVCLLKIAHPSYVPAETVNRYTRPAACDARRLQQEASPPASPADAIGSDAENGGFEIWYSDVSAFFGTRARTVLQGTGHQGTEHVYRIDKDERGDDATGRYVSLRIFHPHKRLRLDWMRVYGVEAASGRRLFGTPDDNDADKPITTNETAELRWLQDDVAAEYAAHDAPELVRGIGEEPAQDPDGGQPEPSAEDRGDTPFADRSGWWHALEVHHSPDDGWLYARRAPPGAHGVSAAGSLGLAVALAEARETEVPVAYHGQAVTMDAMCAWLSSTLGCHRGDHWSLLYNRQIGLLADEPAVTDDDADWATQLLSAVIEPVVYVLVEDSLRCAACSEDDWGVDGTICASCDPTLRGGRGDYERALRLVEAKIGGGGTHKSRSVPDCVSSLACLGEVAAEVAVDMGAATAMPPSSRLAAIAESNELLFAGAVVDFQSADANGREALLRTHRAEIKRLIEPPHQLPQWTRLPPAGYSDSGRRLEEQEEEPTTMTATEYSMHLQTEHTCYMIVMAENRSAALASHAIATQLWLTMDAGGNGPKNSGDICVDCQHPNTTHACRAHFALVGRMLTRMLVREEVAAKRAAEEAYANSEGAHRKRVLEEHVRKTLGDSCCARMPDGREECGQRFCEIHARKTARKRAATVVRRLHEAGHPAAAEMGGAGLQVGIDVIAPELHPDPACRDKNQRHPHKPVGAHGHRVHRPLGAAPHHQGARAVVGGAPGPRGHAGQVGHGGRVARHRARHGILLGEDVGRRGQGAQPAREAKGARRPARQRHPRGQPSPRRGQAAVALWPQAGGEAKKRCRGGGGVRRGRRGDDVDVAPDGPQARRAPPLRGPRHGPPRRAGGRRAPPPAPLAPHPARGAPAARPAGRARHESAPARRAAARAATLRAADARPAQLAGRHSQPHDAAAHGAARAADRGGLARESVWWRAVGPRRTARPRGGGHGRGARARRRAASSASGPPRASPSAARRATRRPAQDLRLPRVAAGRALQRQLRAEPATADRGPPSTRGRTAHPRAARVARVVVGARDGRRLALGLRRGLAFARGGHASARGAARGRLARRVGAQAQDGHRVARPRKVHQALGRGRGHAPALAPRGAQGRGPAVAPPQRR